MIFRPFFFTTNLPRGAGRSACHLGFCNARRTSVIRIAIMLKSSNLLRFKTKTGRFYSTSGHLPLTTLSEDEVEIKSSVLRFAKEAIKPHVMRMDEASKMDPAIIAQCFENGDSFHSFF